MTQGALSAQWGKKKEKKKSALPLEESLPDCPLWVLSAKVSRPVGSRLSGFAFAGTLQVFIAMGSGAPSPPSGSNFAVSAPRTPPMPLRNCRPSPQVPLSLSCHTM